MTLDEPQVFTLHPGDVAVGVRGDRLETLLAAGVAIVLTDPRRTVGAMCHVVHSGPTPRKTFSMGEAHEKRFYIEARRIVPR